MLGGEMSMRRCVRTRLAAARVAGARISRCDTRTVRAVIPGSLRMDGPRPGTGVGRRGTRATFCMLSAFFAFVGCAHAPSLRERAECASWTVRVRSDVEKVEIGPADTAARQNGEPSYLAPYPELLPVLFRTALGGVPN